MAVAKKDQNGRNTIITASSADGVSIVANESDPVTHRLKTTTTTVGDNGNNNDNAMLDENSVPVWTALASDGSGRVIEIYGNPLSKAVFIKL